MNSRESAVWSAWLLTAVFYFYQYVLRSCPAVMMPQLSTAFGLSAVGSASLAGMFYYGYSWFSLVAGASLDRLGPRAVIPVGAMGVGVGALLFGTGNFTAATSGRFLQGAGGAFSFVGAVFIANKNFPVSRAAMLIGAAQMFGMAGGSAGQFLVGPLLAAGVAWTAFWIAMGLAGLLIGVVLFCVLPRQHAPSQPGMPLRGVLSGFGVVFRNRQSILCGLIAGLLFIPTTIFDMIWGVRFLQEAHGFEYGEAVFRSASVPFGWIIGCPLLGWLSDRLRRRKPVIMGGASVTFACLIWILYGRPGIFPPYLVGMITGISSGSAMIPYTVIKESNPSFLSGTATGVLSFLNLTFTAILAPFFGWLLQTASGNTPPRLEHYQSTFHPLLLGVGLALLLTFALKETGRAVPSLMTYPEAL